MGSGSGRRLCEAVASEGCPAGHPAVAISCTESHNVDTGTCLWGPEPRILSSGSPVHRGFSDHSPFTVFFSMFFYSMLNQSRNRGRTPASIASRCGKGRDLGGELAFTGRVPPLTGNGDLKSAQTSGRTRLETAARFFSMKRNLNRRPVRPGAGGVLAPYMMAARSQVAAPGNHLTSSACRPDSDRESDPGPCLASTPDSGRE